jgi:hypothetical protein
MFKNLKNIFGNKPKIENNNNQTQTTVMNAETQEIEQIPEVATGDINLNTPEDNVPTEQVAEAKIPTYEELTSFNPRDIIGSNEVLLNSPEIVGWLSTQEQELLFSALLLFYSPEQSLLDVGCGRADLYGYCKRLFGPEAQAIPYKGIDYNPNMLSIAQEKYPGVYTEATDVLNTSSDEKHDWVVGSGLFNLLDNNDMETYVKTVVQKMYDKANLGVAFNLLTGVPEDMADEDVAQLVVHDPLAWMDYLLTKYTKVICRTDYLSGDVTFIILK